MVVADLEQVFVGEEGEGFVLAGVSRQAGEDVRQFSLDLDAVLVVEEFDQLRHHLLVADHDSRRVPIAAEVGDHPAAVPAHLFSLAHE